MTGPDPNSGQVGRGVTPGYLPKGGPAQRHDKKQVKKSPAPKPPAKGKGRGGKRGR